MSDDDDYEVGYGKPPRHTQFRKGKSGNPAGRPRGRGNRKPRGSMTTRDVFMRIANMPVMVPDEKGGMRKGTMQELNEFTLHKEAAQGNPTARRLYYQREARFLPPDQPINAKATAEIRTELDRDWISKKLQAMRERIAEQAAEEAREAGDREAQSPKPGDADSRPPNTD